MSDAAFQGAVGGLTGSNLQLDCGVPSNDRCLIMTVFFGTAVAINTVNVDFVSVPFAIVNSFLLIPSPTVTATTIMVRGEDFSAASGNTFVQIVVASGQHLVMDLCVTNTPGFRMYEASSRSGVGWIDEQQSTNASLFKARDIESLISRFYVSTFNLAPTNRDGMTFRASFSSGGSYVEVATLVGDDRSTITYTGTGRSVQFSHPTVDPGDGGGLPPDHLDDATTNSTSQNATVSVDVGLIDTNRYVICLGGADPFNGGQAINVVQVSGITIGRALLQVSSPGHFDHAVAAWEVTEADLAARGLSGVTTFSINASNFYLTGTRAAISYQNAAQGAVAAREAAVRVLRSQDAVSSEARSTAEFNPAVNQDVLIAAVYAAANFTSGGTAGGHNGSAFPSSVGGGGAQISFSRQARVEPTGSRRFNVGCSGEDGGSGIVTTLAREEPAVAKAELFPKVI